MNDIDTDELKSFAPIIPYVKKHYSDRIHITRESNKVAFCNCIWHQENTGSLAFFANGTYKCFGCGVHGDIITLVQTLENLSFQEACKVIGDNVGYEIVLEEPNPVFEQYKDILDNHTRRYWCNLQKDGEALRYLLFKREISKEMIDLFRLGLTDKEEYRYRQDIGCISNKIVFPILEHKRNNPKCVGMAYRGLTDEKPKYINDLNQDGREGQNPQLAGVFIKGNMLYGLPMAYKSIKQMNHAILTEGYFDVIAMHQSGFTNTVGSMGTSITETQVHELSKLTNNVLLFLDGDKAGTDAMMKSIGNLYAANLNVAVCILDSNMDPDDLCRYYKHDFNAINSEIKRHTMQGIEMVLDKTVKRYENIATQERIKAINIAMPIINAVQNPDIRDLYKQTLFKRLDL